jgi:flagellar hook-associated protein 2
VTKYDPETEQKGTLFGNPTVARIRSQMYRTIQGRPKGVDTTYQFMAQIGLNIKENGQLVVNEDRLRAALNDDPDAVKNLMAAKKLAADQNVPIGETGVTYESQVPIYESLGVAEQISLLTKSLTNSVDGTITIVGKNFDSLIDIQKKRIERFDLQLESRRTILERQFASMERSLAALQSQGNALSSIGNIR